MIGHVIWKRQNFSKRVLKRHMNSNEQVIERRPVYDRSWPCLTSKATSEGLTKSDWVNIYWAGESFSQVRLAGWANNTVYTSLGGYAHLNIIALVHQDTADPLLAHPATRYYITQQCHTTIHTLASEVWVRGIVSGFVEPRKMIFQWSVDEPNWASKDQILYRRDQAPNSDISFASRDWSATPRQYYDDLNAWMGREIWTQLPNVNHPRKDMSVQRQNIQQEEWTIPMVHISNCLIRFSCGKPTLVVSKCKDHERTANLIIMTHKKHGR